MKDEMENQQKRKMKPENPSVEIRSGITRRTVANGKMMYQMIATLAAESCMPVTTSNVPAQRWFLAQWSQRERSVPKPQTKTIHAS
jgi:hypothetical protein